MRKEALSPVQKQLLQSQIVEEKEHFFKAMFLLPWITLICIFISKGSQPSLFTQFGFWKPAIFISLLFTFFSYFNFKNKQKKLDEDLKNGELIVLDALILQKISGIFQQTYTAFTDSNIEELKKIKLNKSQFERARKGQSIVIRFAPASKYIFSVDV